MAVVVLTAIMIAASFVLSLIMFPRVWRQAMNTSSIADLRALPAYVWMFQALAAIVTFAGAATVSGLIFGPGRMIPRVIGAGVLVLGGTLMKASKKVEAREKARKQID